MLLPKTATSAFTPELYWNFWLFFDTTTSSWLQVTVPFVVTTSISSPDLCSVPKVMVMVPLAPDLVVATAWTVSTGPSLSTRRLAKDAT